MLNCPTLFIVLSNLTAMYEQAYEEKFGIRPAIVCPGDIIHTSLMLSCVYIGVLMYVAFRKVEEGIKVLTSQSGDKGGG